MRIDFRFTGSGGQGVIMLSIVLANAYGMQMGMEVAQTQSYGPEARGGACRAELVVSDAPIDYVKVGQVDVLVAFNEVSFKKYQSSILDDTTVFVDSTLVSEEMTKDYKTVYAIDATNIAEKEFRPVVTNIIMLGFMTAKLPSLRYEAVKEALTEIIPAKMLDLNLRALEYGYQKGK